METKPILIQNEMLNIELEARKANKPEQEPLTFTVARLAAQKAVEPYAVEIEMLMNALKQLEETSDAKIEKAKQEGYEKRDKELTVGCGCEDFHPVNKICACEEEGAQAEREKWKKAIGANGGYRCPMCEATPDKIYSTEVLVICKRKLKEQGVEVE